MPLVFHFQYFILNAITKILLFPEFIKSKMPYKLVKTITDDTVDSFLAGWEDNKVRGLIFEDKQSVRLRYLLAAYHFRDRVTFG